MKYRIDFKRLLLVLLTALLIVVLIRFCLFSCKSPQTDSQTEPTPEATASLPSRVTFTKREAEPIPTMVDKPLKQSLITVYDHRQDKLVEMSLEEYLFGVVSAEMPASFNLEALKAQAVAARTFACYCILHRGCGSNDAADVCTNSQCCQAYAGEDRLRQNWGKNYDEYSAKIHSAIDQTSSLVILYNNEPIEALFHASSGGYTENSENVFSSSRPYLRAVMSTNEIGSRQTGEVQFSYSDLISKVNKAYPQARLKVKGLIEQVGIVSTYQSGRVETLRLGSTTITGKQARKLFGLDSTMFSIMFADDMVVFITKGYGHGVGMSQSGANGMAAEGSSFIEILEHYYTDVTIWEYELPNKP